MALFFAGQVQALPIQLTDIDQIIYQTTFNKCRPGTLGSALKLGYDFKNFSSSVNNWMNIVSIDLAASGARSTAKGITPALHELRNSPGFWLAMTDCYGFNRGGLSYGNLVKQIVDSGHLATEVSSALVGVAVLAGGGKVMTEFSKAYPVATNFIFSLAISIKLSVSFQQIRNLTSTELTSEEKRQLDQAQNQIFAEPDQAIQEGLDKTRLVIARIEEKLRDPHLSEDKRYRLTEHLKALQAVLKKFS